MLVTSTLHFTTIAWGMAVSNDSTVLYGIDILSCIEKGHKRETSI